MSAGVCSLLPSSSLPHTSSSLAYPSCSVPAHLFRLFLPPHPSCPSCRLRQLRSSRLVPKTPYFHHPGCRVFAEKIDFYRVLGTAVRTARDVLEAGTKLVPRRCTTSCTTWNRPAIEEGDIFSENDREEDSVTSSSNIKESWLLRLIFGFSKTQKPWTVSWTSFTIIQVMFLWFCTFWLVGSWIIPLAAHCIGCSKDTLTYRGQALYSLITDIAEGTVGLSILHRCLARFQPLSREWFPFSLRGQWYADVLLGCLMFPIVNRLSQINLELYPFPSPLVTSYEHSIMARDPVASILYAIVVSICCPIWEEVIFRGFLLPSLTRYLPMWASIFVSALVFGLAHFNMQRMLPLTFLGLVMGIMFVRSRNLLSSMLLHSMWNGFVFLGLLR